MINHDYSGWNPQTRICERERRWNCVNLSNILKRGKRLHDANTKSTCETIRLTAAKTCYCSDVTAPPRYYLWQKRWSSLWENGASWQKWDRKVLTEICGRQKQLLTQKKKIMTQSKILSSVSDWVPPPPRLTLCRHTHCTVKYFQANNVLALAWSVSFLSRQLPAKRKYFCVCVTYTVYLIYIYANANI